MLIELLQATYPEITFSIGQTFYWSPGDQTVFYRVDAYQLVTPWPLLHEVGHALLSHARYSSDFELLKLEADAWQKAQAIAPDFGHTIHPDHIQDSLDTYRDWLYQRSTCPVCGTTSLQLNQLLYECFNCRTQWSVTASRFCRPYRRLATHQKTDQSPKLIATFH